jgi:hypothetical protein
VITAFQNITHSTSIPDVINIPDPKHGSGIRANLDTVRASGLRVCVALSRPPTWGVTLVPRRARFWDPKRTPKTASTVGLPTVGSLPVSLVFGYRNRPPEPGLPPRSKPVSCIEFWSARPQKIFEFENQSRTGLLGRRLCQTLTTNQLRPNNA